MSHTTWATFAPWPVGSSAFERPSISGLPLVWSNDWIASICVERRELLAEQAAPARRRSRGRRSAMRMPAPVRPCDCRASAPMRSTPCEMTWSGTGTSAGPTPRTPGRRCTRSREARGVAHLQQRADAQRDRARRGARAHGSRPRTPWRDGDGERARRRRGLATGCNPERHPRDRAERRGCEHETAHAGSRYWTRLASPAVARQERPAQERQTAERAGDHADREIRQPERECVLARHSALPRARRRTWPRAGRCR